MPRARLKIPGFIFPVSGLILAMAAYLAFDAAQSRSAGRTAIKPRSAESKDADDFPSASLAEIAASGIPRKAWPESWFLPPATASEMGITGFSQSPMLDQLVESGELPPVEERLPADPIVIVPYREIGEYGGTARLFSGPFGDLGMFNSDENPFRICPEIREILPNLARKAEFSDDKRTLTIYLRPGVKWSDGHPHTADDYVFWLDDIQYNQELTLFVGRHIRGISIEKIDRYTFAYHFPEPSPLFINLLAHRGALFSAPKHFLRNFHADYRDQDELEREATQYGLMDWQAYFRAADSLHDRMVFNRPVLHAYRRVRVSANQSYWERNPYYPKVDPEGQQLPYIDYIQAEDVRNNEVAVGRASTGQMTFAGQGMQTSDIPLFRRLEGDSDYETYIWRRLHGSDVIIQPNMTHPDLELREIFQDVRFRQALSLAIDRQQINDILYFGQGVPRQLTVGSASRYFKPEFAEAYIDYDPARAKKLLTQAGLIDRTGDGMRERPSGRPFNVTLEYIDIETPKQKTLALVNSYWREVGLRINLRPISNALQSMRAGGGLMDMTVWHADRTSDILFPIEPYWFVPMHVGWEQVQWPEWARWLQRTEDSEVGIKPPAQMRRLFEMWSEMQTTPDDEHRLELGRNILRAQAENLWAIGTVGLAPQPVVVSNQLINVPRQGYWGWDGKWAAPYFTEAWFLRQD